MTMMANDIEDRFKKPSLKALLIITLIGAGFIWAYAPTLGAMVKRWWGDQQYSHGFLVPVFAICLLWYRREMLRAVLPRPNWLAGLALLLAGAVLRLFGAYYYISWFDYISILPCIAGVLVLWGGWPILRWAWPAIAFMFFMFPLPYGLETALAYPLRRIATVTSTYALQTVGYPVLAVGTDIFLRDGRSIQVAPACSGMGMLLVFFALSTAISLIIDRPWLDRIVVLVSAVPIAVVSNIIRIAITVSLYHLTTQEAAQEFFHKWAGYLMMIIGLALLWLELRLLDKLLIPVEEKRPLALGIAERRASGARPLLPNPKAAASGKM
jgi:exosortase